MSPAVQDRQPLDPPRAGLNEAKREKTSVVVRDQAAGLDPQSVQKPAHSRHLALVIEGQIDRAIGFTPAEKVRREDPVGLG